MTLLAKTPRLAVNPPPASVRNLMSLLPTTTNWRTFNRDTGKTL